MFRNKDEVFLSPSLVDSIRLAGVYVGNTYVCVCVHGVCLREAAGGPAVTDTRD